MTAARSGARGRPPHAMKTLEAAFTRLLAVFGAAGAVVVFATTTMISLNILLRNVFGSRVPGDTELSEYAMLLLTAFVSPWLLNKGQHVRIDLMLQQIPDTLAWICEILVDALGFVISVLMCVYGMRALLRSAADGTKIVKEFTIPEWWTLWPLPLMFLLLAIEFVFRAHRVVNGPRHARTEGATL